MHCFCDDACLLFLVALLSALLETLTEWLDAREQASQAAACTEALAKNLALGSTMTYVTQV